MGNKKLKLKEMTNKELMESAFKAIENLGFHITDKQYNNICFFFEGEENSICEFHIKEIPRFRFAFWKVTRLDDLKKQIEDGSILWTDTYNVRSMTELLFFTQYERDLDKFKPSRSGFLTGIYRETWVEGVDNNSDETHQVEEWYMYELESVLKFMKKHPIKAYEYSGLQIRNITDEINGFICLKDFVKDWFYNKKWKFKHWLELKRHIRASMRLVKKTDDMYYSLVLLRPENWSPRVDIIIRRKPDYDYDKCLKLEPLFDKFDDKWFNLVSLDQYDLELTKDPLTEEDIKADKQQEENFIKRLSYHYADLDCDYTVLWCNCEELIDIKAVK